MDKNSYALGMSIAHNMVSSGVKNVAIDDFVAGLTAIMEGREPAVSFDEAASLLDKYFTEIEENRNNEMAALGAQAMEEGQHFLAANSLNEGVKVTDSGLQYKVVVKGTGKKPGKTNRVVCHYEGRFIDGKVFDSSYKRNEPATFGVNQVIAGWTEALQLMSEGSKWELYIPYNLAYGESGAPGAIPPFSTLIFTVELIKVL